MIGKNIAQYRVESELGRGGMGVVYRARDTKLQRDVALKFLPEDKGSQDRDLLLREARAASALNHPNICTIYEVGEAEGRVFIALEHIEGTSLRRLIPSNGLPVDTLLRYATQIAAGLAHAHEHGVIHRDLKAGNVMVARDGRVKLLDFGLAQRAVEAHEQETQSIVASGSVSGTLAYLAPELLRGAATADARSDLWALGVLLYEMAAGQLPFHGATSSATSGAILYEAPRPLPARLPASLRNIITRCLIKEADQRYQRASEVLAALDAVASDSAGAAPVRPPTSQTARVPWIRRAGMALVSVLITLAVVQAFRLDFWRTKVAEEPSGARIQSLAILPFKSLTGETDLSLGMGIADTLITKVSQIGELTVRPSSAVRKYTGPETETLEAARQLQVDSVLDGTVQRAGDRLRLNVNLLRTRDGVSLWSHSFNITFTDIFSLQDEVAQQVATGLRVRLTATERDRLVKNYTGNTEAYQYYVRGKQNLDKRGLTTADKPVIETAITMFHKAIELDPQYALARAQLAYAYVWMGLFADPAAHWIEKARAEAGRAEALDPALAELHLTRFEIFWSEYGDFRMADALRELQTTVRLNPGIGHEQMGVVFAHMGLEHPALEEIQRALDIDPTSEINLARSVEVFDLLVRPDEAIAANQRVGGMPGPSFYLRKSYLWKGLFEKARELNEEQLRRNPVDPFALSNRALRIALQGDPATAEKQVLTAAEAARRSRAFHHVAYNVASIYALQGKTAPAVDWLKKTVDTGMPNYTLFSRDPHLDRIRKNPSFVQFMKELKATWDGYNREFGGSQ